MHVGVTRSNRHFLQLLVSARAQVSKRAKYVIVQRLP